MERSVQDSAMWLALVVCLEYRSQRCTHWSGYGVGGELEALGIRDVSQLWDRVFSQGLAEES
jgi:hypothetical protein